MKSIVTLTVNPTIDVAASVPKVFPDHKLRCGLARHGMLLASCDDGERFASPDAEVQSRVDAATVMTPGTELCCRRDAERLFPQMTAGTRA